MGYQTHHETTSTLHEDYPREDPQWDNRSAKSYGSHYAGSQVHLNPQYEMSQVQPPLPTQGLPYAHQQNYPPGPRPDGPNREMSSGYSTTREKMMRRRSVKKVELQQGNLVLDVQVPTHIIPQGRVEEEMQKMRYTAATGDPDDFFRNRFTLRPYMYGRHTELFIVMTMYNEDDVLFLNTMNAVIKNIAHLCGRTKSSMWGPDGWKKVVVCIVSDGRAKINQRTLHVLSLMGCYQEGIPKDTVAGKDVTAHIFEYTTSVIVSKGGEVTMGKCPVQMIRLAVLAVKFVWTLVEDASS
jgi:chitin synthase